MFAYMFDHGSCVCSFAQDAAGELFLIDYGMAKPLAQAKGKSKNSKTSGSNHGHNPNMLSIRSLLYRATQVIFQNLKQQNWSSTCS